LNDIVYHAPQKRGLGSFIWEPTRHHEAIFDQSGRNAGAGTVGSPIGPTSRATTGPATRSWHRPRAGRFDSNDLIDLYPQMAREYGNEE
jgi:hypothetical protein